MIVLGIDTSGYANAVAVVDGERVLSDFTFEARTDSLERIVADIDVALQNAKLTLEDVQGIGVGLGPGSWTGIRVGVTVGKILAYSTGKPVGGVPTLEALAYSARNEAPLVCAVISAGTRDAVYAAFYRAGGGKVIRAGEYYVGDVKGLAEMVSEPTVFVGPEAESCRRSVSQPGSSKISVRAVISAASGSAVARLAADRLGQGESDDALSLAPLYLKESTAKAFLGAKPGEKVRA